MRFTENVNAIIEMIDANQEPEVFAELVMDLTDGLSDMFLTMNDQVMSVLEKHAAEVETFAVEHRSEGQTVDEQMKELHCQRMERVAPMYRTPLAVDAVEVVEEQQATEFPGQSEIAQAETITDGTEQSV